MEETHETKHEPKPPETKHPAAPKAALPKTIDSATYIKIKLFTEALPRRRMEVDDRDLLDRCDEYLNLLLNELPPPAFAPVCRDTPMVSGTGAVGETLSCTMGNWFGNPTAYAYEWQRAGIPNGGNTADYVVVEDDRGQPLTCVVTATNPDGATAAPPSNPVTAY